MNKENTRNFFQIENTKCSMLILLLLFQCLALPYALWNGYSLTPREVQLWMSLTWMSCLPASSLSLFLSTSSHKKLAVLTTQPSLIQQTFLTPAFLCSAQKCKVQCETSTPNTPGLFSLMEEADNKLPIPLQDCKCYYGDMQRKVLSKSNWEFKEEFLESVMLEMRCERWVWLVRF